MTVNELRILFQYDKWATNQLLEAVSKLPEEEYAQNLASSHGGIRGTLVHIYAADRIWLERWKGNNPTALAKEEEVPTLQLLREKWDRVLAEVNELINSLPEARLQALLSYKTTEGNPQTQPLCQQMQHRINHSTYHRGQVVTLLRQLGHKPPSTDLIVFYRQGGNLL